MTPRRSAPRGRQPPGRTRLLAAIVSTLAFGGAPSAAAQAVPSIPYPPNDSTRPVPPAIQVPGAVEPVPPPSDAITLFNGKDLAGWRAVKGGAARWQVTDGAMVVMPGTGAIGTERRLGDCQLHLEWSAPTPPQGSGQDRGNSGVFLMGLYEVQVLDSYRNRTYADGMAGAVYGQYPPLVNPTRPPGEWQTYDIVFHRPRFDAQGRVRSPASLTVLFNGVLVQDHVVLTGPTAHLERPPYHAHADRLSLMLQDHGARVRYRNIWVRDLETGPNTKD